ncbi:glycosyltransferase 87 family protein [Gordonia caeni]|uniref:Alpha-(1-2)-phosphatidylinositol mannoside mannosyltransferase n=1 Tax=Gordonia caeni TaxID=1007097 RepID=A0ABP7PDS0_9ACTN
MSPHARTTATSLRRWRPGVLAWAMAGLVFVASATLQIVGVPGTSSFGTRTRFDLDVYRLGGQLWHQGISLYAEGSLPFTTDGIWLPFTYPPFAAMLFTPLGAIPLGVAGIGVSIVSAACLLYVTVILLRMLHVGSAANRVLIALWISAGVVWCNPFGMTISFGQINIILMTLIVVDLFVVGRRPGDPGNVLRGALTGLASAIKLTPLVFLAVFAAGAKWRAVLTGVITFVLAAVIAVAWLPSDSLTYWTHTLFHTGRIGLPQGPINQNLNAFWLRLFGADNPAAPAAWVLSGIVVTVLAAAAVWRTSPVRAFAPNPTQRDDVNAVAAACAIALWGLVIAPTTWAHHWVWALPAILVCTVIAVASRERWTSRLYGALAVLGVPVFAIGPFQLMPADVNAWVWWQQVIGNAYLLWGLAFLILLWLKPFRNAAAPVPDGAAAAVD